MKKIILGIGILIIVFIGGWFLIRNFNKSKNQELELGSAEENVEQQQDIKQQENKKNVELKIEILEKGNGPEAKNGDNISVHYTGTLLDGTKFDSSVDRGMPFLFVLGQGSVIQGWELGLLGAQKNEKRKLIIPPELGYGKTGTPGGPIPGNAVLIFEIEVLNINNK